MLNAAYRIAVKSKNILKCRIQTDDKEGSVVNGPVPKENVKLPEPDEELGACFSSLTYFSAVRFITGKCISPESWFVERLHGFV